MILRYDGIERELTENMPVLGADRMVVIGPGLGEKRIEAIGEMALAAATDFRMSVEHQLQPGRSRFDSAADKENLLGAHVGDGGLKSVEIESAFCFMQIWSG